MGDNIAQIIGDKLNKENYHIWLYWMDDFLMGKGLWGLANGEDECPESIPYYVAEIRKIIDDLASINWRVQDDDMVSVMLNGLGPQYKSLDTSISVRGTMLDFDELVALCMIEEVKLGRPQALGNYYHCGKYDHFEKDSYYKQNSQRGRGRSHYTAHGNFSTESSYRDYSRDNMFAMEHVLNRMSKPENDMHFSIDSGRTNHMTSIGNWFELKEDLKTKEYVATSGDTLHLINDVANVLLVQRNDIRNTLSDALHVLSITNNLVLVDQLAYQDMEVIFNKHGYFIHYFKYAKRENLLGHGKKIGRLFMFHMGTPL
ncbi:hypothetical protein KP509_30G015500 [Ceratopteris richardii]|uniref:Retrovirus-related Pol polyprotein from transposon TNT 1-94-like beta-barrel domain-containing protein n=1 Tax=Ceratopteris richardii TaxID=49495 RepID=A0A8T2R0X0_CERRI|nr:hypothetical protein KP509_30G015500 [Ceratopteris richardii]